MGFIHVSVTFLLRELSKVAINPIYALFPGTFGLGKTVES